MEIKTDKLSYYSKLAQKYNELTFELIGIALEVHKTLGPGFLEAVYGEAYALELASKNIPFKKEEKIHIKYKDSILKQYYIADFVCYDSIIVELKAVESLMPQHSAQVINYLNATDMEVGLLLNFGERSLKHKRFFNFKNKESL